MWLGSPSYSDLIVPKCNTLPHGTPAGSREGGEGRARPSECLAPPWPCWLLRTLPDLQVAQGPCCFGTLSGCWAISEVRTLRRKVNITAELITKTAQELTVLPPPQLLVNWHQLWGGYGGGRSREATSSLVVGYGACLTGLVRLCQLHRQH